MRVIQASVAKRIAFATWARKQGLSRHSSASFFVPDDVEVPENLMSGAQVDGQPYQTETKPKTRRRKRKDTGPVEEPAPDLRETTGEIEAVSQTGYEGFTQSQSETQEE
jgi:hypothetical protein